MTFLLLLALSAPPQAAPSLEPSGVHFAAEPRPDGAAHVTAAQVVFVEGQGGEWMATADREWVRLSARRGSVPASVLVDVPAVGLIGPPRTDEAHVTFTFSTGGAAVLRVTLDVLRQGHPPVGAFDLPADGTTVSAGRVRLSGWALDDINLAAVEICRDPIPRGPTSPACGGALAHLGAATFYDAARPDVAQAFPSAPHRERSGWTYVLDTDALPRSARGTFRVHAIARDIEGRTTRLGFRTITIEPAGPAPSWVGRLAMPLGVPLLGFAAVHLWLRRRGSRIPAASPEASMASPAARVSRWEGLAIGAIVILAAAIRWPAMYEGLAYDELYTYAHFVGGVSPWTAATTVAVFNNHIAYSLLANAAVRVFGSPEWVVRLPALVLGALTVYALWRFARSIAGPWRYDDGYITMNATIRRLAAAGIVAVLFCSTPSPRAASVPPIDRRITYILPQWFEYLYVDDARISHEVTQIRSRIGEGLRVKVGFTTYITINMSDVDPADVAAVRAAIAPTIAQIDSAIARARTAGIPICLSFLTQAREGVDPSQTATQARDRRSMQWHSDNTMATGWVSLSRYSRRYNAIREAFIREIGRQLSERMLLYPDTVVAASGDGEIELASDAVVNGGSTEADKAASKLADYSPFAIAEFRDWLRAGGMYAAGQPFAGQAYSLSARYAGDASPADDTNADGHTLYSDFGASASFSTWQLKHFDWSLADSLTADPKAIPAATYTSTAFTATPSEVPAGFDAPRTRNLSDPFWSVWNLFRQNMVYRNNLEFAKWMTTTPGASGATVPADRWFTDQVAADALFTNVAWLPSNPAGSQQDPNFRYDSSASPHWTADVTPYGSLGITAFNVNIGPTAAVSNEHLYYRTLAAVGPLIAARNVRWGIFEWNPSVLSSTNIQIYDLDMALVEKYRPSLLVPYEWGNLTHDQRVLDTPFETALKNFVTRRNNIPLTLSKSRVYASTLTTGAARSAPQVVRVTGEPGETPAWNASSSSPFVDIVKAADGRSFTVALKEQSYAAGVQSASVVVQPTTAGYTSTTLTLEVTANAPAATTPPVGSFDTPADLQIVTGEVGITGWTVDDVGIQSINIWRSPLAGEPTQANGLVFLGTASPVEGARPDIETAHGTVPGASQAGWGYMLLSNFLPNNGNGVFTLHATVTDLDGHTVALGTRRIDCRNGTSVTPFGTLDTPLQGQTVSGTIVNFGWALTPLPNAIPIDGSTVDVFIDNVRVGSPVYNNFRSDIAGLFPGLANSNGAVGYFYIDTTTLTNGRHSISWVVRDNTGAATGIGSRYFTVVNP